jgi:hypothetical protein
MLERATSYGPWYARYAGSILAIVFGGCALLAGFWTQFGAGRDITAPSDLRIVLPLGTAAIIAGIVALVRRERQRALGVAGMVMAAAAPMLGWVVLIATIAALGVIVVLIVAKFH